MNIIIFICMCAILYIYSEYCLCYEYINIIGGVQENNNY